MPGVGFEYGWPATVGAEKDSPDPPTMYARIPVEDDEFAECDMVLPREKNECGGASSW